MIEKFKSKTLYKLTSLISLTLGILFLITAFGFIININRTDFFGGWCSLFQSNWLIVIFKLHAGLIDNLNDPLHGLNLLDTVILTLFSFVCFGLNTALRKSSKIWSIIAFAFSLIAIMLFIVTQNAGRSTVMLSVLIFSFVMLKDKIFGKLIIYVGILAAIFLFVGDLTVGIHSSIITILFGIGYVFLTLWFFLIAHKLLYLESQKKKSKIKMR